MRWRRCILIVGCVAGSAVLVQCGSYAWRLIEDGPAGIHQRSVKNELADWEREYGSPRNWHEAARSVEIMEYVQKYYVPGPGYRGSARSEAAVEAQRARTLTTIAEGLHNFTGQDFGTDVPQWRAWFTQNGHSIDR